MKFMKSANSLEDKILHPQDIRKVLGMFATGVTIMTTRTPGGECLGSTVSSFNSVSLDPPLILFSLARTAQTFASWEAAEGFAVNILSEDQVETSNRFARSMTDKWSGTTFFDGPATGHPLLSGALVTLECKRFANYDGGDHLIIVGQVVAVQNDAEGRRPLLFYGSRYRSLDTEHKIVTPLDADIWLHGW
jgi:flavin reductase (DIM6/NTAB) family NADH-FMN oxidoreductase RutF